MLCFAHFRQPESDETVVTTSYNESFESDSNHVASKEPAAASTPATESVATATPSNASVATADNAKKAAAPTSPRLKAKLSGGGSDGVLPQAPRSPKSNKSPFTSPVRRNSESESEDSFSFTHSGQLIVMMFLMILRSTKLSIYRPARNSWTSLKLTDRSRGAGVNSKK